MTYELMIKVALILVIPMASAISYVHINFTPIKRTENIETVVRRVDKIVCKMAIKQNLEDAVEICTK